MAVANDVTSLLDGDLDGLSSDELSVRVLECQRLRGQLEAAEARLLSRWDAERCWQPSGAKSGAAWLAWKQRIPIEVARERVRHARALRTMPEVAEAWADVRPHQRHDRPRHPRRDRA